MVNRFVLIVIVSLFTVVSSVQAQDAATLTPVIAVSKGDIYAINPTDGSVKQITHHPSIVYTAGPFSQRDLGISPDGQYLAYLQTPRFFQTAMKNNLIGNFSYPPSDVVLLNLTTGQEKVLAQQQPNVSYTDAVRLWYRYYLTWSPDSSQLAYTQTRGSQGQTNYQSQLMIYNVADDQTSTFVDSDQPLGEIAWMGEGIAAGTSVWDIEGHIIINHYLNDGMFYQHYTPYQYGEYAIVDGTDVVPHDGQVYLMDMMTGVYSVANGIQSSVAAANPDDSFVFLQDDNDTRPRLVINPKNGSMFTPPTQAPYAIDFTFSPDGHDFAYILLDTSVNISNLGDKQISVPLKADTIIWGNKSYTVASQTGDQSGSVDPTDAFSSEKRCGTLTDVGLTARGQGMVITGGGPNRIRRMPYADSDVIGQIPEGGIFDVVDGQQGVCSNAIRWAQVTYQGVTGWTAEGADGKAFLEPVQ